MSDPKEDLIDLRMAYDAACIRVSNLSFRNTPSDPREAAKVAIEYDVAGNAMTEAHGAYLNALRSAGL